MITIETSRADVTLGESSDLSIQIERDENHDADVIVTATGLPDGLTVDDVTATVADANVTLTLTAAATAVPGTSAVIQIEATDGTTTRTLKLELLVRGQPGTLDNTFGTNGVVTWNGDGDDFDDGRLIVLPDGRILLGGSTNAPTRQTFTVMRFTADGVLDETFGTAGLVQRAPGPLLVIADAFRIRENGTITVAGLGIDPDPQTGEATYAGVQLQVTAEGAPDPNFGTDGIRTYDGALSFQDFNFENGKALVVGNRDFDPSDGIGMIGKLDVNGDLDPSFGTAGLLSWPAVQGGISRMVRDEASYVATASCGTKPCVVRFDAGGKPDDTWGSAGVLTFPMDGGSFRDLGLNAKGQYIVVGDAASDDWLLARVTRTGQILTVSDSFTTGDDNATHLLIDGDSYYVLGTKKQPLATPNAYAPILVRYDAEFQRDPAFAEAGVLELDEATSFIGNVGIVKQPDGRLVVGTKVRGAGTLRMYRVWN